NHFYVESDIINIKLILPFEVELICPNNSAKLPSLSQFVFKVASNEGNIKKLFSKENADYFLFGLLIRSYDNEPVFLNTFKYWLDDLHKDDEKLEIKDSNGQYYSLAKLKKKHTNLENKAISDFLLIDTETGKITIKKDSLLYTNILPKENSYDKYVPYYWDICIQKDRNEKCSSNLQGPNIVTCCFGKEKKDGEANITLSSNVNINLPTSYSSNGAFNFHLDDGNETTDIISNSYIVKATDNFSFNFLKDLNAKIIDKLKVSDEINETYYKIISDGKADILPYLLATKGIINAEHDVEIKIIESVEDINQALFSFNAQNNMASSINMNDPLLKSSCYSLNITQAFKAYNEFGFGKKNVIAGIMDTGINEEHEDFFTSTNTSIISKMDNNDIEDDNGHGTHCAGIIAGVGNNDKGIAGVAWKNTQLIPLKINIHKSWETYKSILRFIKYIKTKRDNNELVQKTIPFNMSFGSVKPTALSLEVISKALAEGILPIVAMGNSGSNFTNYPAAYPGVVAVGSSNGKDKVSFFSDRGRHISIVAPGENIISTGAKHTKHYYSNHGTSMAAPFVTGAVAYLMTFNLELTPFQIKTILEKTASKIEGNEDFNMKRGFGRINIYEAAKLVKTNNMPVDKFFGGKLEIALSPSISGHIVSIYDEKNVLIALGITKSDGKVEFRGLLPNKYTIKVNALNNKIYSRDVRIPNNSNNDILISF
ncbi:MAG: dentilisin complex serine proteinase subunit PrtP, partial [Treponema sp.]